jgi:FkbM family methyltransferase
MRRILNIIKTHTPLPIWEFIRGVWYGALSLAQHIGPYVRTREYCGFTLFFNRGNAIVGRLKTEPIFEEKLCVSIVEELRRSGASPALLDIGANIGLILAYVVSKVPDVEIFAFEPGPTQRGLLEMTISKNHLNERIKVFPEGLGRETGKMTFHTHDLRYVAHDGFIDTGRARGGRAIEVNVVTLDSWWASQNSPKIDVIKIDTEGAELWILQGAARVLTEASPVLYLEIDPRNLKVYPYSHLDILSFLNECHYELLTLSGTRITKENFSEYIGIEDTYVGRPANSAHKPY